MNLGELKTSLNDSRRDVTNSFITDSELTRYLNKGLRWLQTQYDWDFTQVSATVAFTNGSPNYQLSAIGNNDFKAPINLFYIYQYQFTYVSPEDFNALKNYSYNLYAIDGNVLQINTTFGTGNLTFDYYSTYMAQTSGGSWIAELSASADEPLMKDIYQDIVIDYGLTEIFRKEGKMDDYTISRNELADKLNNLKRIYKNKAQRLTTTLKNPRAYQMSVYDRKENVINM